MEVRRLANALLLAVAPRLSAASLSLSLSLSFSLSLSRLIILARVVPRVEAGARLWGSSEAGNALTRPRHVARTRAAENSTADRATGIDFDIYRTPRVSRLERSSANSFAFKESSAAPAARSRLVAGKLGSLSPDKRRSSGMAPLRARSRNPSRTNRIRTRKCGQLDRLGV